MDGNKIISSICYFGMFLVPVLIPLAIYIFFRDSDIRSNARYAMVLQIVPTIATIGLIIVEFQHIISWNFTWGMIWMILLVIVVDLVAYVWNLLKGLQVLFFSR